MKRKISTENEQIIFSLSSVLNPDAPIAQTKMSKKRLEDFSKMNSKSEKDIPLLSEKCNVKA